MATYSASLTNLTSLLSKSRDCNYAYADETGTSTALTAETR